MPWLIFSALSTALGLHITWLLTHSAAWTMVGGGLVIGGAVLLSARGRP